MTTITDKIIALAKLDGFVFTKQMWDAVKTMNEVFGDGYMTEPPYPKYFSSYDAIIPLVQKQDELTVKVNFLNQLRQKIGHRVVSDFCLFTATPTQIADALLAAKGLL